MRKVSDRELRYVAEHVSQQESCSDCVGTTVTSDHCKACTNTAMAAITGMHFYQLMINKEKRKKSKIAAKVRYKRLVQNPTL